MLHIKISTKITMDRKVYYGEYRLSHWIDLLLKQNIKLPKYQRTFVWDEERVKALLTSLRNWDFVPPVTIGAFNDPNNANQNLILDGQQRLTSVFLAYLGLFPKKEKFQEVQNLANENDEEVEPGESGESFIEWTLEKLINNGHTKEEIWANVDRTKYEVKDWGVDQEFFNTRNMGFTYLVPSITAAEQQKYYSTAFRNINK